jgi:hypothetical protein
LRGAGVPAQQASWRSFLRPSFKSSRSVSNPDFERDPVPLDVALDRINPAIILIDRFARELFTATANPSNRYHYLATGLDAFRARRHFVPKCVVRDPTYGTMEIYEVGSGT